MLVQRRDLRNPISLRLHIRQLLKVTVFPLSMSARSQTLISPASRLNSFTCASKSLDHLLTISSMVFPRNIDGGGTAMLGVAADAGAPVVDVIVVAPADVT